MKKVLILFFALVALPVDILAYGDWCSSNEQCNPPYTCQLDPISNSKRCMYVP